ncbi:MAG TPA: hypothetical protein VGX45_15490 [Solirubrobacteraceae bacterium]|nr:hypothetical protein [Solirubrobacteraceae bacterium]
MQFDDLIGLWQDGTRRLEQAEPPERAAMERVRDEVVVELRRRLGGPFTTDDLAALYIEQGPDWVFDLATRVVPATPAAWDVPIVGGAAFARYAREASDYGGGRRAVEDEE